ncbi:hypothetical protein BJX76DRAFT_365190 [Aspergillus varians]
MHSTDSDVNVGQRVAGDTKWYIIDTIEVGSVARARDVSRAVRLLAAKLAQTDPLAFGLLNCKGVVAMPRQTPGPRGFSHFQFVFRIPGSMEVLSTTCTQFAFVHKNVRPESVLFFEDPTGSRSNVSLVGLDAFWAAGAGTMMAGDMGWDRNVYRHPLRQGDDPADRYRMQHDIYSLGVWLLEVGIWESFVEYTGESEDQPGGKPQAKFGRSYYRFQTWMSEKKSATGISQGSEPFLHALGFKLKDYLVELARTRLPPRMGEQYTRVVVSCLTFLDDDNEDFVGLEENSSDDAVAVHFNETAMKLLNGSSV